jgi:hypothetical protein
LVVIVQKVLPKRVLWPNTARGQLFFDLGQRLRHVSAQSPRRGLRATQSL